MRIAILGIKRIPASFGGFETFAEHLATRLVERGYEVTVYCRAHFVSSRQLEYKDVRLRFLPPARANFYQASSLEVFGNYAEIPQNVRTSFRPRSPYGCAKAFAHFIAVNYREAYKMFACNDTLYNHESERSGETFISRKITRAAGHIKLGLQQQFLGNLKAHTHLVEGLRGTIESFRNERNSGAKSV